MRQAIRNLGITWRRWIVPLTCGVVGVNSLWRGFTTASDAVALLYLSVAILAIVAYFSFELWYYKSRKKSKTIGQKGGK